MLAHAGPIRRIGEAPPKLGQLILRPRVVDVGQQLPPLPHEVQPAPQEIARRPHRGRIDVGLWQEAAAQQRGDLEGIELVVLGLPAVDGFHRQRVPQHEGNPLGGADIGEPVPREHALGRHDEILAIRGNGLEQRLRIRLDVAVHEHVAARVEDADVHRLHVQINPAIVSMLTVVESHSLSSCAGRALALRQPTTIP